ncbi:MAG: putative sulfate exporter family transporter [Fimbriiglobus sp.]
MNSWLRSEDTLAVLLGLLVVGLSLGTLSGTDVLGWAVAVKEWTDPAKALAPAGKAFAPLGGQGAVAATYAFLLVVLSAGARFLGHSPKRFAVRFTVLFALAFACWAAGHYAYIAATPNKQKAMGIGWSLGLTGEAGYLLALLGGLLIANVSPAAGAWFKDAARSELYIKAAIVIYGAVLGLKAAEESGKTTAILFRGAAAIVEAYLIYWALVYLLARTVFGFSREWAAPLASGISICGVTAAIATGAAIRARPVVPVMVSSLVVVFAVIEMLVLPPLARYLLPNDPLVAAAWMGLAVKTDGAAFSSGEITAALYYDDPNHPARAAMALTTTTVKVCIDVFIGVWAVVLSAVWTWKIEKRSDSRLPLAEIWARFPKFVFGYGLTFGGFLAVGLLLPAAVATLKEAKALESADVFRRVFFVLTFFSIGLSSNFRRLWAEGVGRLALLYAVSLFGFVIWIGLGISWLFFGGMAPPTGG